MNNIAIAKETIEITKKKQYICDGQTVLLPDVDFAAVDVISPQDGEALLQKPLPETAASHSCVYSVTTEGSFGAALRFQKPMVQNFANAHHAGGGFLLGANAQEEALCRCSTLYASITSPAAKEMYRYNNTHLSAVESDYMLFSPNVLVFRDGRCELMPQTHPVTVMTIPAPNRHGAAALTSGAKIKETFQRRIRIMLRAAIEKGCRDLVLGAWGCGAFGNDPNVVAGCFRQALIDENLGTYFENVCFAIYGSPEGKNYRAFLQAFQDKI